MILRLPGLHLLRQLGDALQIFLVLDGLGLAGRDDLVEQGRHLLVEGRVVQVLLDDLAADVVLDGLGDGVLVALQATELRGDGFGDAGLHDQLQQAHVVEGRDLPRLVGLDVGVDEVPHVGLVGLQVEALAAGLADDLADVQVVIELLLDAADVGRAVAGRLQLVGDVRVGAHQGHGRLVERGPLRLPFLQVGWDLGVAAEVVDVLQLALRRLDRLAEQGERLQRLSSRSLPFFSRSCSSTSGSAPARAVIEFGGVDGDGVLDLLEQVLVVDDVAEVLVLAVQPVDAADRLEQAVVLHRLVDVEIGAGRRVEAGEQLVHDDQQLHVGRLLDEQRLGPLLVGLGLGHARLGVDVLQQLGVGVVDELLVGLGVGAGFFQRHVLGQRVVGGHHRALALERRLLEQREILAGLVDARRHQDGVARVRWTAAA